MAQNKVTSDILRCPTVTLMDRSEAHVGHAAVSDSDSQRTRALGGARKNVSKTGTHMRMHEGNSTTMTIQPIVIFGRRSNIMINKNHARFERSQICDRHETRLHGRRPQIATLGPSLMTASDAYVKQCPTVTLTSRITEGRVGPARLPYVETDRYNKRRSRQPSCDD